MNFENLANTILTSIFSIATGLIVGRKMQRAKIKEVEIDAFKKMQESYNALTQHMNDKFKEMQDDIEKLHKENLALKKLVRSLKSA